MNLVFKSIRMNNHRLQSFSDIIAGIFIFLFTYTSLTKIMDINSFIVVLTRLKLVERFAGYAAWFFIVAELLIALVLLRRSHRLVGLYASFSLMLIFSVYIGSMLLFAVKLPCSCGGVIGKLSWQGHLLLNISLLALYFIYSYISLTCFIIYV